LSSTPSVAIVILNWNGKKYLEQFLPSIFCTSYTNFRVIVVDNASNDNSIAFLKTTYPQVEVIVLSQNFGFAKGYNEGLRQVDAEYYVLLNSDVEVTPNWLEPMVALLEQHQQNAACQPKMLALHEKELFEYAGAAGGWIDSLGYPFARGRVFDTCEKDEGQYNDTDEVFWASGAALMIRSDVFHSLKGFDDFFFAHQEEIDLCWRIHLAGYRIYCCPSSIVYHVGGGTLPKGNARKTFLNFRNNNIMLAKNLPLGERWWKLPLRLVLDQVTAFKELVGGDGQYFMAVQKAHVAFIKWMFLEKKSNRINAARSMKQIPGVYKGSVVWQYFIKGRKIFSEIVRK
jgi:GT2 family glycosyltransferase